MCLQNLLFEHIALNLRIIYSTVFSTKPCTSNKKNLLLFVFLKHNVLYTLIQTLGVQQRIKSPFYEDACDYREVSSAAVAVSHKPLLVWAQCSRPVLLSLAGWQHPEPPWEQEPELCSHPLLSYLRLSHAPLHFSISKLHCFPLEKTGRVSFSFWVGFYFLRLGTAALAKWRVCAVIKMEWDFYIIYTFRFI